MVTRILSIMRRCIEPGNRSWDILIIGIAAATAWILWYSFGQTFNIESAQQIWQSRHSPHTVFQFLLSPFSQMGDIAVVFFTIALSTLAMWLFAKISTRLGMSRPTVLILVLLLNFSPDYNHTRLNVDGFMVVTVLWLTALWWFLHYQERSIYIAFIGWAIMLWVGGLFDVISFIWALAFPLCFLLWPGERQQRWWRRLIEHGKFILGYYALIVFCVALIPQLRLAVIDFLHAGIRQFNIATREISLLISTDISFELSPFDTFIISFVLVVLNTIRIAGVLIVFLLAWSFHTQVDSILTRSIKRFFVYCLFFSYFVAAVSLFYQSYLGNNLYYQLIIMILLWLGSGGAFDWSQRLRYERLSLEKSVILLWVGIAYALASIIQFGPSAVHRRLAGQWLASKPVATVYSNSALALYYAGKKPHIENDFRNIIPIVQHVKPNDYWILDQNRKRKLPQNFDQFTVVAQFSNKHGDTAYVLQPKSLSP